MVNPRKKKNFGNLVGNSGSTSAPTPSSVTHQPSTSSFSQTALIGELTTDVSKVSFGGDEEDSKQSVQFAPKTLPGNLGQKVTLKANFFKIAIQQKTPNYFHYNIEFIKNEDKKKENPKKGQTPKSKKTPKYLNNLVFSELFKSNNKFQIRNVPVFDGEKNFYSLERLNGLKNGMWSGLITVKDQEKDESFKVNITTPEISHSQSLTRLLYDKENLSITPIELQALDIIMRNGPRLTKIQCGFNFFLKENDPNHDSVIFEIGRDLLKFGKFGHYQCARIVENGVYYNVDRAMQIFTWGGSLGQAIDALTDGRNLNQSNIYKVEEQLKGLKFRALHLNYKRTFIINGFSKTTCKDTKFKLKYDNGKEEMCSVYDYYQKNYSNFVKRFKMNPNQLLVQVGSKNNAKYFPIECCELEENEVYRRKLKPDLQGMVTRKSGSQLPSERFNGIVNHVKTIENDSIVNGFNYLKNFGIQIETTPATVKGRILTAPEVEYAKGKCLNTSGKGSWDMKGFSFYQASDIGEDWCVINFDKIFGRENRSSIFRQKVDNLIKSLIAEAKYKGCNLSTPRQEAWMYSFNYQGKNTLENTLFKKLGKNIKLAIILIPSMDEIYNEIKTISEINLSDSNIITQCLKQDQKYWRENYFSNQLITNFFLKINPKTGGINNIIKRENKPQILKSKLMIIGLDVTHPSPTDGFNRSVASCVATFTKEFDTVYHETIVQEKARKEVVRLKDIIKTLLKKFNAKNEFYPQKILVYRDGIGEGDFQKVLNTELKCVQEACLESTGNSNISITYVVVQKRHNTRFIPASLPQNANKANMQNIKPGTVVDSEITHHKFREFYLCSHAGGIGTSRPTKYVVLYDDNRLSSDDIQAATYCLCYLYPRCTKSSSIPPVVAYAHFLCTRGKSYLLHMNMDNDGQSSISSGPRIAEQLSERQLIELNEKISVKSIINGRLYFV